MVDAKYWNATYQEYWREKVAESNLGVSPREKSIPGDNIFSNLIVPYLGPKKSCLDVGCGWGRLAKTAFQRDTEYFGSDISQEMIDQVEPEVKKRGNFIVAPAEKLKFDKNTFDFVFSLGVFDCTNQAQALFEMIRVCKIGGYILFSGKNNNYRKDDKEAKAAEIGARSKGESNFFTNYEKMRSQLLENGHSISAEKCFVRRGDFAHNAYLNYKKNRKFYEYVICVKKSAEAQLFHSFSDLYSETFLNE